MAATLMDVRGGVLVSTANGLRSATSGMTLSQGTRILTTASGSVSVNVAPGCDVMLTGNQRLTVAAFSNCQSARSAVEGVSMRLATSAQALPAVQRSSTRRTSTITLAASALFPHDVANAARMLDSGRAEIDLLLRRIIGACQGIERIVIEGHADITNSTRDPEYNDRLSLARAVTVRDYIAGKVGKDIKLEAIGFGHKMPVKTSCAYPRGTRLTPGGLEQGKASAAAMAQLYDCLQPNRRVVVRFEGDGLVCGVPPVAQQQPAPPTSPALEPAQAPAQVAVPQAPVPVPPVATAPVAPPPPVALPPTTPVAVVPPPAANPAAMLFGGVGVVGLGYYLYDRDRRNTSPN
ncbi:MAG: OmpA family protein [Casimicrobiaceae bacterium]